MQLKEGVLRGFIGVVPLQTPPERTGDFPDPVAMLRETILIFARTIFCIAENLPNDSFGVGKPGPPLERKFFFCRINDV